jgi:transporter family-2 protein
MIWFFLLLAFLAGAVLPVQTGVNSRLAGTVGHPTLASLISFIVGTLGLLVYTLALRIPLPQMSALSNAPFWIWFGGMLGAFFIATTTTLAAKIGATVLVGLIIAGQLIVAVMLDHFGLLGFVPHPINLWRVLGILLLIAGVFLIKQF